MDMIKIGEFLKQLRKEKNLTQEQFAEILHVSGRTVSRWETGRNMPDISILIQIAEFYSIQMEEIFNGEKMSGGMDKEMNETLSMAADYSKFEKEKILKAGNNAFLLVFFICAAVILIQLVMNPYSLSMVIGETVVLLAGGSAYIMMMIWNGVWENALCKYTLLKDRKYNEVLISIIYSFVFTILMIICYVRLGAEQLQVIYAAVIFFIGISILSYSILKMLAYFNGKKRRK